MSSALRVILGLSFLATIGCDDGGGDVGGDGGSGGLQPLPTAGTATAGTGNPGGGSGGTGTLEAGVPLTPMDGWVDMASNTLGIQGAMFAYADDTSKMGLVEDFLGDHACIKGEAAEVDLKCTPDPGMDCYGKYWGAAIGLNLNQPIDPVTMMGVDPPLAFDAGAKGITGFAFEITGSASNPEGMVPGTLRFKIEDANGEYCNVGAMKPVMKGPNSFTFSDLQGMCWKPAATNPTGDSAKSAIIKIAWQVVTKTGMTIPFDFCVSNVRALQ